MAKNKNIRYLKKFKYTDGNDTYEFQLVKKRFPWWWLLLLLPLLLFIKCSHNLDVAVYDAETDAPVEDAQVTLDYTSHFLYDAGEFLRNDHQSRAEMTNEDGVATFENVRTSVFSYVFYCLQNGTINITSDCQEAADRKFKLHWTRHLDVKLDARRTDIVIQAVDLETGAPLPDATIDYEYDDNGKTVSGSDNTDPNGCITVKNVRYCGVVDQMHASSYGYNDTTAVDVPAAELTYVNADRALKLRRVKKSFTFFIKDEETKEPVAGATAVVTLTYQQEKDSRKATTDVNGVGTALFDDAFIRANVAIDASHPYYYDGKLEGTYTVDEFRRLPDDKRIVWLKPKPQSFEFQNVDSITGAPIAGVQNTVKVTRPNGDVEEKKVTSNANGVFRVEAVRGSKVEIYSERRPEYKDKNTVIPKVEKGQKIPMAPNYVSIDFRTLDADTHQLLGNCGLSITSGGRSYTPTNSGNGNFTVKGLLYGQTIYITATHTDYKANNYSVAGQKPVEQLMKAPQNERDIPLEKDFPPCDAGNKKFHNADDPAEEILIYNMGQEGGTFDLEIDANSWPDIFVLYDGIYPNGTPLIQIDPGLSHNGQSLSYVKDEAYWRNIRFTTRYISVVCRTGQAGSIYNVIVHCPK